MKSLRYLVLLLLCVCASAQTVTITLQVTDAGAQSWNNGTWSAQLTGGSGTYNIIGTSTPVPNQQQSGTLSGTGGATVVVTPNSSIAPAGTQWTFSVCPNVTSPCFQQAFPLNSTQTLTITPPAILINMNIPLARVTAYSDAELTGQLQGNEYFNVTSLVQKIWNGSAWIITNAGTLGLADPGSNGIVKRTALNTTAVAVIGDLIALFSGTCNATTFLRGDGSCQTVSGGSGNVTTTPGVGVSQQIVQQVGTDFNANITAHVRTATPSWNWIQSPAGSISAGANTITLTPCPLGIDTTNFAFATYTVYLAGTGTPEVAPVTGGTCTSGASSGTIIVTALNTHSAGFTVGSESSGIQEAINDACRGVADPGGQCEVDLEPAGSSTPNYTIQGEVYLNGRALQARIDARNAVINCANPRAACIFIGNHNSSGSAGVITNLSIANGNSYGGVAVLDVTAAAGTYTIHTATAHNFSMTANMGGPDYVYVDWHSTTTSNRGIFKVTSVADNTHFTYVNGSATFANQAAFGGAGLENAMIEDNLDASIIEKTRLVFGSGPGSPLFTIVNDNDQHLTISKLTTASNGSLCFQALCGAVVYSRGDSGNAGITYLKDSELSMGCNGNGVLALGGNGFVVKDTVIQGFQQYGIYTQNSLQPSTVDSVYEEVGACTNPQAPSGAQTFNTVGLMSLSFVTSLTGAFPMVGSFPQFISGGGGGSQINYFVVWNNGGNKSVPLPIGTAQPANGGVSIPVSWPAQATAAAQLYDLIATTGSVYTNLSGTQTVAVATSQSCTPNAQGWCSFTDTQAARSSYTFATPTIAGVPSLWYWPGPIVLNGSTLVTNYAAQGLVSNRGNAVSVVSNFCPSNSTSGPLITPVLYSCLAADPLNGTGNTALFLQQPDQGNNTSFNLKGRLNFGSYGNLQGNPPASTHIITVVDSNVTKTVASSLNRPTNDANDTFIGIDNGGSGPSFVGMTLGAPNDISMYIGNIGDGTNWKMQLLTSGLTLKTPLSTNSAITSTSTGTFSSVSSTTGPVSGNWNCVSVAPVTVSTSTTNDQNLMACTIPAGTLNSAGKTLRIHTKSLYTTPAASVATLTFKAKLCSVSGCGSGNVATLVNITSSANPGSVTNNTAIFDVETTTQTAGAASRSEASGNLLIDLGAVATSPDTIFADTNATVVAGSPSDIDFTVQNFLQITVAFSVASGSNSVTERQLVVDSVN